MGAAVLTAAPFAFLCSRLVNIALQILDRLIDDLGKIRFS
jgi:hypothetical protein